MTWLMPMEVVAAQEKRVAPEELRRALFEEVRARE